MAAPLALEKYKKECWITTQTAPIAVARSSMSPSQLNPHPTISRRPVSNSQFNHQTQTQKQPQAASPSPSARTSWATSCASTTSTSSAAPTKSSRTATSTSLSIFKTKWRCHKTIQQAAVQLWKLEPCCIREKSQPLWIRFFAKRQLVTIFSAPNYCGECVFFVVCYQFEIQNQGCSMFWMETSGSTMQLRWWLSMTRSCAASKCSNLSRRSGKHSPPPIQKDVCRVVQWKGANAVPCIAAVPTVFLSGRSIPRCNPRGRNAANRINQCHNFVYSTLNLKFWNHDVTFLSRHEYTPSCTFPFAAGFFASDRTKCSFHIFAPTSIWPSRLHRRLAVLIWV